MTARPAAQVGRALRLLEDAGAADIPHPSGMLLAHLRGTEDCLERWGCPGYLCAAGLHHSVYGTEAFRPATVSLGDRGRVRDQIGAQAEELVYLYCVIARQSLYENLDRGAPYRVVDRTTGAEIPLRDVRQLADLLTLDVANRLEQLPRTSMSLWRMEADRRRYEKAMPLLPAAAVTDLRRAYRPRARLLVAADGLLRAMRRIVTRLRGRTLREVAGAVGRRLRGPGAVSNPFDSGPAARRYAEGRPDYHDEVLRHVAAFLGERLPVGRALDVGCGTGQSTRALRGLARRVIGVDASEFMLREARPRAGSPLAVASAERLPLRAGSVDLIVASAAFHWFDQRWFLDEARRVARPGAWLVVYDNGFSGDVEGAEELRRWHRDRYLVQFPPPPRHETFSPRLAARAGFAVRCTKRYENRVEMDAAALVRFLITQSNVIAAVEAGAGTVEQIAERLRGEVEPFFREDGRPVERACRFGGPLWIAVYETS